MSDPQKPTYDTSEATVIFARAFAAQNPHAFSMERMRAAEDLLRAVQATLMAAGYKPETARDAVYIWAGTRSKVFVSANERAEVKVGIETQPAVGPARHAPIEYDARAGVFVGQQDDTFYVPVPGEPRKRRSAVAVVAEMMAELLKPAP